MERERERQRDKEREIETERDREGEGDREKDRETERTDLISYNTYLLFGNLAIVFHVLLLSLYLLLQHSAFSCRYLLTRRGTFTAHHPVLLPNRLSTPHVPPFLQAAP